MAAPGPNSHISLSPLSLSLSLSSPLPPHLPLSPFTYGLPNIPLFFQNRQNIPTNYMYFLKTDNRDTEHPFSPLSPLSLPTLSPGWCLGGVMHLMTFTHFTIPYYFCGLTKFCSFFPNYRGLPLALSGCWFPGSDLSEVANQIPWKLWCHRACGGELGGPRAIHSAPFPS